MALIKNIFEIESVRNPPLQCRQIHLFLEGTFFRLVTKYIKARHYGRYVDDFYVVSGDIPVGRVASAVASFRGVLSHGKNARFLRLMTL